jgi:RNA polymerase sigma-70 factor (ECF subfamily)
MAADGPFTHLMSCLQQGHPDAARHIFQRYAQRLVALAANRLPAAVQTKEAPEDVVQSVFRTFFRRQAEGRFVVDDWDRLWKLLAAITIHKCGHRLERWLADCRDVRREQGPPQGDTSYTDDWRIADPSPTPAEAVLLRETLEEMLQRLSERQRPVVLLRLQGYSIAEIAEQLRCSERTILRHLEAARDQCLHRLPDEE